MIPRPSHNRAMLSQIFSLLLGVVVAIVAGACLARFYMQYQRIPFQNPLGRFVMAVSSWIVLPLRKLLPAYRRWDLSSLLGAYLIVLAERSLLWLLFGRRAYAYVPVEALFGVVYMAIWGVFWLMVVYAVLSWVRAESLAYDVVDRMCSPLLRPFRRVLPLVGGVDLSPLALMLSLQVALIVLAEAQGQVLRVIS